jgi:hypothetical protein
MKSGKGRIRTFGGRPPAPQKSLLALFEGTFASRLSEQAVFEDVLLRMCRLLFNKL